MIFLRLKLLLVLLSLSFAFSASDAVGQGLNPNDEYIIISGGPALIKWESFRRDEHKHDKWWGNFVRSARIRIQELQKVSNKTVKITWLVYRRGYEGRATEDGEPLISYVESVRDKYHINLVWYDSSQDIINYVNSGKDRRTTKVSGFEYFGHSNKYCFLLDYSNHSLGTSRTYLHQRDLSKLSRNSFAKKAFCKSWGCYTGESFSKVFRKATGKKMIGAVGKTDYADIYKNQLPVVSPGGRWVH